jgi:steroid delta-isomerase-like uncharacterized protein
MYGEESNAEVVRRWFEQGWNQGDADLADQIFSPNYVHHVSTHPQLVTGVEETRRNIAIFSAAFPDMHFTIEDQVSQGDRVMTRWTMRGTHDGDLLRIKATGKPVEVQGMVVSRFENGLIVEEWDLVNTLGMLEQLGALEEGRISLLPGTEMN